MSDGKCNRYDLDFEKRMENDELPKKNRTIKFADILENHKVHTFYWDNREIETSAEFLEASYYAECQLNNTRPLSHVVQQLQEKSKDLTLKGEKLDLPQEYLYKKILQELLQKHIRFFE